MPKVEALCRPLLMPAHRRRTLLVPVTEETHERVMARKVVMPVGVERYVQIDAEELRRTRQESREDGPFTPILQRIRQQKGEVACVEQVRIATLDSLFKHQVLRIPKLSLDSTLS
jgi:hypothetical protein